MSEASTIFELGPKRDTSGACAVAVICCALLVAWATHSRADGTQLALTPRVCALSENEALCQELIDIQWRSGEPMRLCLFVDTEVQPLACWREQRAGVYEYQAQTQDRLVFELRVQPDDQVLASETFDVIREQTEYRYRRRKPWNFF